MEVSMNRDSWNPDELLESLPYLVSATSVLPARAPAYSPIPQSQPISGANQFADSKREVISGKHHVTAPPGRSRASGPVAESRPP